MSVCTRAQTMQDVNGRPVLERKYTDVEGNPYLTEQWLKGSVTLVSGESYNNLMLKYDLVKNEPLFQNSNGEVMTFVNPVRQFTLTGAANSEKSDLLFRNGFKAADGGTAETFYQVLSEGETPLLKKVVKVVDETKAFNSATAVKTFQQVQMYFLVKDGLPLKVRKEKKVILEALGDHSPELEDYIKTNKLNLKSEPALVSLVTYYNSLK